MVRRFSFLLGLVLLFSLFPLAAHAQDDKIELFGGYSYMRVDATPALNPGSGGFNLNGWELSGQYKFADWLGAVADVDGHSGSPSERQHLDLYISIWAAGFVAEPRVAICPRPGGRRARQHRTIFGLVLVLGHRWRH